jgi:hypothetical protein
MAFTKITAAGIGSTETVTLDGVSVINNESIGGNLTVTGNATIGGVLTYEDVTNVDSVGLITARNGIVVGSGITLSKDGDIFTTGVSTFSGEVSVNDTLNITGNLNIADKIIHTGDTNTSIRFPSSDEVTVETSGTERLAIEPAGNVNIPQNVKVAGVVTATSFSGSGADLTGLQAGKFVTDGIGITTATPVGIETTSIARKDLAGPAGNTATGAGSSFHGAYMGDGFLSFNTEFSNPTGYYISTFTNALVAGPMQLGTTLSIDGTFTIV